MIAPFEIEFCTNVPIVLVKWRLLQFPTCISSIFFFSHSIKRVTITTAQLIGFRFNSQPISDTISILSHCLSFVKCINIYDTSETWLTIARNFQSDSTLLNLKVIRLVKSIRPIKSVWKWFAQWTFTESAPLFPNNMIESPSEQNNNWCNAKKNVA